MKQHVPARERHPPAQSTGPDNTRAEILAAARAAFGRTGLEGTSVRAVAERAGVNASTVIYFFYSKEGLFKAAISDVAPATEPLKEALLCGATGSELVERYLAIWEDNESGPAMRALIRATVGSHRAAHLMHDALLGNLFAASTNDPLGGELALTQLLGLAIGRHVSRLPELSRTDIATIAARVGPVIDAHLHGRDDGLSSQPTSTLSVVP